MERSNQNETRLCEKCKKVDGSNVTDNMCLSCYYKYLIFT